MLVGSRYESSLAVFSFSVIQETCRGGFLVFAPKLGFKFSGLPYHLVAVAVKLLALVRLGEPGGALHRALRQTTTSVKIIDNFNVHG